MAIKVFTILGARPQFIKAATLSRALRAKNIEEIIVHTGQHFDSNMSEVFFTQMEIPFPNYNLGLGGLEHGAMTGRMLEAIEVLLKKDRPDWVLVYGDTNSTLAGALAAVKLQIPVAHVEAGLRSFNMVMPEEINRILTDRVSSLLFCPTKIAVDNLTSEGIKAGVYNVGDVMYDAALFYQAKAKKQSKCLQLLDLSEKNYGLATCHRAENTDDRLKLSEILTALAKVAEEMPLVFPLHPRTRKLITQYGLAGLLGRIKVVDPLPYIDMVALEQSARVIFTDSGGIQKEAFFYNIPCITMRDQTEWLETVTLSGNQLVGASSEKILTAFANTFEKNLIKDIKPYGDGTAAEKIASILIG